MEGTSIKYNQPQMLKRACLAFNIDYAKAKLIRYYSNLVYDCGDKVLRLTHSKNNWEEGIIAELTFMQFLIEKGLPVVPIVLSVAGNLTKKIEIEDGYFTVACFEKIVGYKVNKEIWQGSHFEELGMLTGLLHKHSVDYQKEKIPKFLLYRDLVVYGFLHKIWKGKELTDQDIQYKKKIEKSISIRRKIIG